MNITKNQIDDLNATLKVEVEKADYAERVEKELKNYQHKAEMPGFRKGKVPYGIIRKMYGKAVTADVLNELLGKSLDDYIKENKLDILGNPLSGEQKEQDWEGEKLEFSYDIALSPEVDVKLSKRDKVTYYKIKVDDKMVGEQVDRIRRQSGEMRPVDEVEGTEFIKGEMVELNDDNSVKENGVKNEDASLSLVYIKDEESLKAFKGAKAGTEVTFNAAKSFPNATDFHTMLGVTKEQAEHVNPNFRFTVKEIKRMFDAEMNQELFDRVFGKDAVKSEEEFRNKVREDIERQMATHADYRFTADAKEKLLKKNEKVALPEAFLKRWILSANKGMKAEDVEKDFEGFRDEFKWQVISVALAKEYNLKVEEADVTAAGRAVAAAQLQQYGLYGLSDEQLDGFAKKLLENEEQRHRLYDRAMEDKIFATVKENVKLEEKDVTMDEFNKLFEK